MTTHHLLRHLIAVTIAVLAAAVALPVSADETFSVTVPVRVGRPSGRVNLTLYLAAAPTPGVTKVTIGGEDVVLGAATKTLMTAPRTGDKVRLFTVPGANAVTLRYQLFSLFLGGKLCESNPAVLPEHRTIDFSFTGPAITEYRINTYVAPSQNFGCGQAAKRIAIEPATVTFDAGAKVDRGRHPLDVVLVLDESGSMSSPPNPASSDSKWKILTQAVPSFIDQWATIDAPSGTQENSNDRLGIVRFATTATAPAVPFFVSRGPGNPTPHPWDSLGAPPVIPAADPPPMNLTALGQGLALALANATADPQNDAVFIVMSDGMQNVDPRVLPGLDMRLALSGVALYDHAIPMETIYFGEPGGPGEAVLDQIALETSGTHTTAIESLAMVESLMTALVTALKGNTISLATNRKAVLATTAGPLVPLVIDSSAERTMLSLMWEGSPFSLDVQLFPPGATPGPNDTGIAPTSRKVRPQSVVEGFDGLTPGTWQMRVVRTNTRGTEFSTVAAVPHTLSAHFLEKSLDYIFFFDEVPSGTGKAINVRAEVSYNGVPLAGLPANAIRLHILRPGEGLGNILHDANTDPGGGAGDVSAYSAKVAQLANTADFFDRITPKPFSTISLTDAGNGVYTGTFTDTSTPGLYRFDTRLEWNDPRTGFLRREEALYRHVRVTPDPESTTITTTPGATPGTVLVTVTPKDKFGNFMGPGYASRITATVNGAGVLAAGLAADPQQTGVYTFTVTGVPAGQTPDVDIVVDGVPVGGTSGGGGGTAGAWRFFIDGGVNFPDTNTVDGVFSLNAGIERLFTSNLSVEGILGYHRFESPLVEPDVWQLSANAKYFFTPGPLRPFVNGGVGVYRIDPPDDTEFGFNAGAGLLYEVNAKWGFEAVYNYHSTDPVDWSTLQLGLRWHF